MYSVFALTLLASVSEGLGILLLLPLLSSLDTQSNAALRDAPSFMQHLTAILGVSGSLPKILGLIGLTFFLKGLLKWWSISYSGRLYTLLAVRLRTRLFDAYSGMSYLHYSRRDTGHFVNMVTDQIGGFQSTFSSFVSFVGQIVNLLVYFVLAFLVAWRFGLMALASGVLVMLLFKTLNERARALSRGAAAESAVQSKLLIQALQAFKYLKATAQMKHVRDALLASIGRLANYQVQQQNAFAISGAAGEPLAVGLIILIVIVQITVLGQPLSPIIVSIILFNRGLNAVMAVQGAWQQVARGMGSVELVDQEFKNTAENRALDGGINAAVFSTSIELQQVSFAYGGDQASVLSELSISIPANQMVAFVGHSGAGKSTLVDLLCMLFRPTSGRLLIDGVDGSQLHADSWRQQIGYVSQESVIFDDTIANNISLWCGDFNSLPGLQERVRAAAVSAYLDEFIETLPDGYHTVVGDRGIRLSGGQKQRLFIARELFKNPKLLILDEATSALDTESERAVQASIDSLHGKMTVIIIAHRLSTIRKADWIFVFDSGRVVESGNYQALLDNGNNIFSKMVELQKL